MFILFYFILELDLAHSWLFRFLSRKKKEKKMVVKKLSEVSVSVMDVINFKI